jgi:amino acid permease
MSWLKNFENDRIRRVEVAGLFLVLIAFAVFLLSTYSLKAYSDPGKWYVFGKNFVADVGSRNLAYGFPFVVWIATGVVGKYAAFLVNVPILMGLLVVLYFFSKEHFISSGSQKGASAQLCGAVTILLFLFVGKSMLHYLSNPYRDPLSCVLMILCGKRLVL